MAHSMPIYGVRIAPCCRPLEPRWPKLDQLHDQVIDSARIPLQGEAGTVAKVDKVSIHTQSSFNVMRSIVTFGWCIHLLEYL